MDDINPDNEISAWVERYLNQVSFSSKMLATLHSDQPIWDKYVVHNLELTVPKKNLDEMVDVYEKIVEWYEGYIRSLNEQEKEFDFVLMCREKGGLYGAVGSDAARGLLLSSLETGNLGIQYFIGKQSVADRLIVSVREIDWRKGKRLCMNI